MAALLAAGCTAGGLPPPGGGGAASSTILVNLTQYRGGYAPSVANVAIGNTIQFVNTDGFAHTATVISGATTFPAGSPFTSAAQTQSGTTISQNWSSGTLAAGASSQTLVVDRAGTYLYGCFFHYGSPMRATIVAR